VKMYKIIGARNYPMAVPSILLTYTIPIPKTIDTFKIAGLYDASIEDNMNIINFYGYNNEKWVAVWHKNFEGALPIRLDAIFFEEVGYITHSAIHPSLPLFLTIYQHNNKNQLLISYEIEEVFGHAGHFIEKENIIEAYWLDHLPLLVILTENGNVKIIGPDIKPIAEDINSFSSMLSYLMNTHTKYIWKYYYIKQLEDHIKGLLHIHTFCEPNKYRELLMVFSKHNMILASINVKNTLDQKGLDIDMKTKGVVVNIEESLNGKYLLKSPKTLTSLFKVALHFNRVIGIYTAKEGKLNEKQISKTGEIKLPENLELIRVNSYQMPIISIIDTSKTIKMYKDTGKYIGFINPYEIDNKGKITKVDILFYHSANILALLLLLDYKMILLSNKYQYESELDFVIINILDKPVPYCLDSEVIKFEQTSCDSIILCTNQKGYLIHKKAIREVNEGRKKNVSLKVRLHVANEVYPVYHPSLLRGYLIFGDIKGLQMILLHLYDELKNSKEKVLTFLGIPVTDILTKPIEQKKVEISQTSDIFDSFTKEDSVSPNKVVVVDKRNEEKDLERLKSIKDELIEMIQSSSYLALNESEKTELVSLLTNLKEFLGYQKAEDDITQEFLLHMNLSNFHWTLGNKIPISTMDITLAYHCQNQDWLLKLLLDPIGNYCWEDIKRFGIPIWLKNSKKLKEIVEQVAKEEYKRSKAMDVDKVNEVSLWYIMMEKKNVLMNLYRHTQQGEKVYNFLGHDFAEERWKKAASRNAYQLFSQKRYVMAAAFYLLGKWINEAVQVATTHLKDFYLAITICRLMGEEGMGELNKFYREYFIEKGIAYGDPWLATLGNWLSGNYIESLNCIDEVLQYEESYIKNEANPQLNLFNKEGSKRSMTEEWIFENPSLTGFNESFIVLYKKLEKHYLVLVIIKLGYKIIKERR